MHSQPGSNGALTASPSGSKPKRTNPVIDRIPLELRERAQWVCWKYEKRDDRWTKVPVSAKTKKSASSTDPGTWTDFETALDAFQRDDRLAGIGYVFAASDPYAGVDLDDCIDESGQLSPLATAIIDALGSYAEVSPSGRGVKVFVRATLDGLDSTRRRFKTIDGLPLAGIKEVEIYDRARFFTVTGDRFDGSPDVVADTQSSLSELHMRLSMPTSHSGRWERGARPLQAVKPVAWRGTGSRLDDERLIELALRAANGSQFRSLMDGDLTRHGGDASAADLSLCNLLAFWTGKDAAQMDRIFRSSGLIRDKWDKPRGSQTYGAITIARAIEDCTNVYTPKSAPGMVAADEQTKPDEPDGDGIVPLGERVPDSGRLVLSPKRTLPTAEAYVSEFCTHPEGRTLVAHGGVLMEWRDNRYQPLEEASMKNRLQPWLHDALRYVHVKKTDTFELRDFESNPTTVKQALETIVSYVHLQASTASPSWLDGDEGRPPAIELLPCRTMNLHIPTGRVVDATPKLFTTNALDFDYEPDPEPPERWIRFLEQLFGDDLESVELLQEWLGYCLTADTSQQKMLLVVGPRRSGKGTLARVVTQLVGAGNVVGPTTGSLATQFGLQPLIGKSLAIVSDARFSGDGVPIVVERLLCITGEDTLTIDRKYLGAISTKLQTRFVFLTNELPRFKDASNALTGRFLVLRLRNSFYGREDQTLTAALLSELPGILSWSLEGWKRLQKRGRFIQPSSSTDAIQELEDLASPVGAFVREHCTVGPGQRVTIDSIYSAYCGWCESEGWQNAPTRNNFGKDLAAAVPGIVRRRGTGLAPFYAGIGLKSSFEAGD